VARGNDVTRDGGDFVGAGAAGRGGGRLGTCWMFYDKYKRLFHKPIDKQRYLMRIGY